MKILFIASLNNPSASGLQRLWAMRACGLDVLVINKDDWASNKIKSIITNKFKLASLLCNKKFATHILELVKTTSPDIVWFEWCKELPKATFYALKGLPKKPLLVSFTDDNPWGKRTSDVWMWRNYFKCIPFFDIHVVKRDSDIEHIQQLGGTNFYKWIHGIYTPLFKPANPPKDVIYPVSFVGTCMDGREQLIGFLLENGIDIHVFGNKWRQRSQLPLKYPNNFHAEVECEAYVNVIQQSSICLGLVSHSNEDEWTMRTFEVVGCKKLLLAENTPTHNYLFSENVDKVLFDTYEDCLQKLTFLQENLDTTLALASDIYASFLLNSRTLDKSMFDFISYINNKKKEPEIEI